MAYIDNVTNILQIQPDGLPTFVRLSQNENGRNLYFQLAGNEIDIPSNATVTISGTKPDGNVYSGTGSVSDNVVLIPEMLQMTAVAGTWDAKVKITSGGNTIATGRVRFIVDADAVAPGSVPSSSELEGLVAEAQQYAETARTEAYGSPLTAQTAAGMTDHTRVYVYTGSETGYTAGHWYFWNGSAWTDGGIYNSVAVNTDTTLTLSGVAADAKATGDAIEAARVAIDDTLSNTGEAADAKVVGDELADLKGDLEELQEGGYVADAQRIQSKINTWLTQHPEATTTVQDGSLTETKFSDALKLKTIKDYVTPEMYGAVGDGVADDSDAIQLAFTSGKQVLFSKKTYLVSRTLYIDHYTTITGLSSGWNMGATVIKASSNFSGEYIFEISHNNNDYCRSINISNINLNCNLVTGGILAVHLYDSSILKNINITKIGVNFYGLNCEANGHVTQTTTFVNLICVADSDNQRDNTKALINFERLQECTLINVRAFTNNSDAIKLNGSQNVIMLTCATYDYANTGIAYHIVNYIKAGAKPLGFYNINMIGCLNEGNGGGLVFYGLYQRIYGTFDTVNIGDVITQNDVTGVIGAVGIGYVNVFSSSGRFAVGSCSIGNITSIKNYRSGGVRTLNYQPKINDIPSDVKITGLMDSIIEINDTIGTNNAVNYTLSDNDSVKVIVSSDNVGSVTNDQSAIIEAKVPKICFSNGSGKSCLNQPTNYWDGMEVEVISNGTEYDCRMTLPTNIIYGSQSISINYFTRCRLKVVNGLFEVVDCNGSIVDKTAMEFIYQPKEKIKSMTSGTIGDTAFESNNHYINPERNTSTTINMSTNIIGKTVIVTSVNSNSITVNFQNNATLPDGETTSVNIMGGETKTFKVLKNGIVNIL